MLISDVENEGSEAELGIDDVESLWIVLRCGAPVGYDVIVGVGDHNRWLGGEPFGFFLQWGLHGFLIFGFDFSEKFRTGCFQLNFIANYFFLNV